MICALTLSSMSEASGAPSVGQNGWNTGIHTPPPLEPGVQCPEARKNSADCVHDELLTQLTDFVVLGEFAVL